MNPATRQDKESAAAAPKKYFPKPASRKVFIASFVETVFDFITIKQK